MTSYKIPQEVILFGVDEKIQIPEIKVKYNKGKVTSKITCISDAAKFLRRLYGRDISIQEQFVVLFMDVGANVLGYYKHSLGTVSQTVVDIPLILGIALKTMARNIIISHNHPSGTTSPSKADISLTSRFIKASKIVGLNVFDHVIITKSGYYSFIENDELKGIGQAQSTIQDQLQEEILIQLKRVTASNAPKVYDLIQTESGYQNVEQRIITLVVRDKITPSACIPQIENEL